MKLLELLDEENQCRLFIKTKLSAGSVLSPKIDPL